VWMMFLKTLDAGGLQAWNALPDHQICLNKNFLARYNKLTADKKVKMEEFMLAEKAPAGYKGQISFDVCKTIDIGDGVTKSYTIHYDDCDLPDFTSLCPERDFVCKPDATNGLKTLEGNGNDLNRANGEMQKSLLIILFLP